MGQKEYVPMMRSQHGTASGPAGIPLDFPNELYDRLLQQMHAVADEALDRLRRLHDCFPADLPTDVIDAVRADHAHSAYPSTAAHGNRRCAPRFTTRGEAAVIADPRQPGARQEVTILD